MDVRRSRCGQHLLVAAQTKKDMGEGRLSAFCCLALVESVYPNAAGDAAADAGSDGDNAAVGDGDGAAAAAAGGDGDNAAGAAAAGGDGDGDNAAAAATTTTTTAATAASGDSDGDGDGDNAAVVVMVMVIPKSIFPDFQLMPSSFPETLQAFSAILGLLKHPVMEIEQPPSFGSFRCETTIVGLF